MSVRLSPEAETAGGARLANGEPPEAAVPSLEPDGPHETDRIPRAAPTSEAFETQRITVGERRQTLLTFAAGVALAASLIAIYITVQRGHATPSEGKAATAAPAPPTTSPAAPTIALPAPVATPPAPPPVFSPELLKARAACRRAHDSERYDLVITTCEHALELRPEMPDVAVMVAHAAIARDKPALARRWAERATVLDPALPEPWAILGMVDQSAGRAREAAASYRRYLELAPEGRWARDVRSVLERLPK